MTIITIFENTHRAACTDALGADDLAVYDANIEEYFEYVKAEAAEEGFEVEFEYNSAGASYSSNTNDGHEFMQSIKDFWTWFN